MLIVVSFKTITVDLFFRFKLLSRKIKNRTKYISQKSQTIASQTSFPLQPCRLHCDGCHHSYQSKTSLQSSSLSVLLCSETLLLSLSHLLRITMRSRLASESHKIPLRAGNIYLGGHFDSKEIQPPCCQDLRGEHIHFLSQSRKCKMLIAAKNSTAQTPHKESKSSLRLFLAARKSC